MLSQNCNNSSNNNNIVAQPEAKKPRVLTATSDPEKYCSGFTARPAAESSSSTIMKSEEEEEEDSGRERLERHRIDMARGRVWIPDMWGQESFLKEWVDCSAFDASLVPEGVVSARLALVEECRRANSARGLRIENRC